MGGGTGLPAVLRGLVTALPDASPDQLTALVTVTDDGGSSGRLRRELGVLAPGDIRNCLAALADPSSAPTQLLQHRFTSGADLNGHSVGNLMLAGLIQMTGDVSHAVQLASQMLSVRGRVLPCTNENACLRAEFAGGGSAEGETAIVAEGRRITRLSLDRSARPLPDAIRALVNADVIVMGPGSLYTSLLPNLLVDGIASTIFAVGAIRILVGNLMTEPGETENFSLDDHVRVIRDHAGLDLFDYVLVNCSPLPDALRREYERRGSVPIRSDDELTATRGRLVRYPLAAEVARGKIRHQPDALAAAILDLAHRGRPVASLAGAAGAVPPPAATIL